MTTALYIALGVLVVGRRRDAGLDRALAGVAGGHALRTVLALRVFNIVLLVAAFALVAYALLGR